MESPNVAASEAEILIKPTSTWSTRELRELWDYRELFWILAVRDIALRYKQAVLGVGWVILQPVAQTLVFTVLFNRLVGVHGDNDVPYPVFCLSGLVIWQLFSNGLSQASDSLVGSANLITKVFFPRLIIPMAAILATTLDFVIGCVMLLIVMLVYGVHPHASAVLVIPLAVMAGLSAASFGLWTSAANLLFRDVRYILPFFLQLLVFLTPVFYPVSLIPERWRLLIALNPVAPVIESFRAALFGHPLPLARLAFSAAVISVVGFTGYLFFRSTERTFADRV
jgi:lipopolysaccharide transport system permease protein